MSLLLISLSLAPLLPLALVLSSSPKNFAFYYYYRVLGFPGSGLFAPLAFGWYFEEYRAIVTFLD